MKYVLVRTYSAGVHYGELVERNGREVTLANTRRIWSWQGANSLSEIATNGCAKNSRISVSVPSNVLPEMIEMIEMTDKAVKVLSEISWNQ